MKKFPEIKTLKNAPKRYKTSKCSRSYSAKKKQPIQNLEKTFDNSSESINFASQLKSSQLSSQIGFTTRNLNIELKKLEEDLDSQEIDLKTYNFMERNDPTTAEQEFGVYRAYLEGVGVCLMQKYARFGSSVMRGIKGLSRAFLKVTAKESISASPASQIQKSTKTQPTQTSVEEEEEQSADITYFKSVQKRLKGMDYGKIPGHLTDLYERLQSMVTDLPSPSKTPEYMSLEVRDIAKDLGVNLKSFENELISYLNRKNMSKLKRTSETQTEVEVVDPNHFNFIKDSLYEKEKKVSELSSKLESATEEVKTTMKAVNSLKFENQSLESSLFKERQEASNLRQVIIDNKYTDHSTQKLDFQKEIDRLYDRLKAAKDKKKKLKNEYQSTVKKLESTSNKIQKLKNKSQVFKMKLEEIEEAWTEKFGSFEFSEATKATEQQLNSENTKLKTKKSTEKLEAEESLRSSARITPNTIKIKSKTKKTMISKNQNKTQVTLKKRPETQESSRKKSDKPGKSSTFSKPKIKEFEGFTSSAEKTPGFSKTEDTLNIEDYFQKTHEFATLKNQAEEDFLNSLSPEQREMFYKYMQADNDLKLQEKLQKADIFSKAIQFDHRNPHKVYPTGSLLKKDLLGKMPKELTDELEGGSFKGLSPERIRDILRKRDIDLEGLPPQIRIEILRSMEGHDEKRCGPECEHLKRAMMIKYKNRGKLYPIKKANVIGDFI